MSERASSTRMRVNVIAWDNGVGLGRDLRLVSRHLAAAGIDSRISSYRRGKLVKWFGPHLMRLRGLSMVMGLVPRYDVNIYIEHIRPEFRRMARRNLLMPNPEWFDERDEHLLPMIDGVLAKTDQTEAAFARTETPVVKCGFTSEDRMDASVARVPTFFHLAGRSTAKGTRMLLTTWQRHPEWPLLTVVQNPRTAGEVVVAPNIDHRVGYIDDAELRELQNRHLFHLCPSEAEGFGHYIGEALSVGAIVLTTDGAPMNELVDHGRGILIPAAGMQPLRRGFRYRVTPEAVESAVQRALGLDEAERTAMSAAARDFFVRNDAGFPDRLAAALATLG